jgi:poly(ADP-ribose) glycohydrolase ARH3
MTSWRGYGPGARHLLELIREGEDWRTANQAVFPEGSFGNGAAMRAAPLGLFYHRDVGELLQATELASRITHAHPLGIEGGTLIARAVALALQDLREPEEFLAELGRSCKHDEYRGRLRVAHGFLDQEPDLRTVRKKLGRSVLAHESAVTAVYAFCRFPGDYAAMVEYVIQLGGDTDTIGAMAGGIFGALNGPTALPADTLEHLEQRREIEELARRLHGALPG